MRCPALHSRQPSQGSIAEALQALQPSVPPLWRAFVVLLEQKAAHQACDGTVCATRADAQADLFEYIEVFYNRSRRHSTLGYSSPVRFLENWISKHAAQQSKAV